MNTESLDKWIVAVVDGTITRAESEQLLELCRRDPEALDRLVQHVSMDRLLHAVERDPHGRIAAREIGLRLEHERVSQAQKPGFIENVVDRVQTRRGHLRFALAALAVFVALVAGLYFGPSLRSGYTRAVAEQAEGAPTERPEAEPVVAVLKRAVHVTWSSPKDVRSMGTILPAGWLRIHSGTVQVEFLSGASLLIVGPAEVRLDTTGSAFVRKGVVSAHVPEPARGFRLDAERFSVVDLGTAFGMRVSPESLPEVHVFEGNVVVKKQRPAIGEIVLTAGKAVRVDNDTFLQTALRPADYPSGEEFAKRADVDESMRRVNWQRQIEKLADHRDTLLCYTFEDEDTWSRNVTNHASQAVTESHGTLVGAAWTAGRWPGKHAVEFRSLGDRLRFAVPGKHKALTLMAWVRVDSLPNDYNSLILPSLYEAGTLHWMIERGGELRLTMVREPGRLIKSGGGWAGPVSGHAITNLDFGRWAFLATTYNGVSGETIHYFDGRPVGRAVLPNPLEAVLGKVEFGNWGADGANRDTAWVKQQKPSYRTRNFVGRVDELSVSARILTAEEILAHFESGRP